MWDLLSAMLKVRRPFPLCSAALRAPHPPQRLLDCAGAQEPLPGAQDVAAFVPGHAQPAAARPDAGAAALHARPALAAAAGPQPTTTCASRTRRHRRPCCGIHVLTHVETLVWAAQGPSRAAATRAAWSGRCGSSWCGCGWSSALSRQRRCWPRCPSSSSTSLPVRRPFWTSTAAGRPRQIARSSTFAFAGAAVRGQRPACHMPRTGSTSPVRRSAGEGATRAAPGAARRRRVQAPHPALVLALFHGGAGRLQVWRARAGALRAAAPRGGARSAAQLFTAHSKKRQPLATHMNRTATW